MSTYKRSGVRPLLRAVLSAVAVVILSVAVMPESQASHYYLTDVGWFSTEQMISLRDGGIQTTEHLLAATVTADSRKKLATQLSVDEAKVLEMARECELLQINGVGPKVVKLLQAAKVTGLDDLGGRKAAKLLKELVAINAKDKITEKDPSVEMVTYWIDQAKTASVRVAL